MRWTLAFYCASVVTLITLLTITSGQEEDATLLEPLNSLEMLQPLRRVRRATMREYKRPLKDRFQLLHVSVGLSQQFRFLTKNGPYIIQLHLYLDKGLDGHFSRNSDGAIKVAKEVVNFANTLLKPFNAYITVTSLHSPSKFTGYSPSVPDKDILEFLRSEYAFNYWQYMFEDNIDCIFTFLGRGNMNYTMSDSTGELCKDLYGRPECIGFVTLELSKSNYIKTAGLALAHELSHRIGASHDSKYCQCNFPRCLMNKYVVTEGKAEPIGWSTCSINSMADSLDALALGKACLSAKWNWKAHNDGRSIMMQYSKDWGPTCGNGIVEPNEECDCGGPLACQNNRCCQADTCKLVAGAACGFGDCCNMTSCTPLASGVLCRLAVDHRCDYPEFCDGVKATCPPDLSVMSDWPCDGKKTQRCRLRACLPPRWGAKFSGPRCELGKTVPTTAGDCKPMHEPGPAEQLEEWVDPLPKDDIVFAFEHNEDSKENNSTSDADSKLNSPVYHQPVLETQDRGFRHVGSELWLAVAFSVALVAVLLPS